MTYEGRHRPVGAYHAVGQLTGDCSCGDGRWPCPEVVDEAVYELSYSATHLDAAMAVSGFYDALAVVTAAARRESYDVLPPEPAARTGESR